jgi:wyosine [tRNA(Phe)-imidazoG37] synthetase (radical SAM superfamily)
MIDHIFGPVISRRLGRSLGIDLLPFKTCSYNCVYCECGFTTEHSSQRREFFPVREIICELNDVLSKKPVLDYITFAGSGEPTLSKSLGQVLSFIKDRYPGYKVAVLTNGSLLSLPEVRNDLLRADLIIPTLSVTSQQIFEQIHRPVSGISINSIIEGITALRDVFPNQIWIEIFLVPSLNTTNDAMSRLRDVIYRIKPDRVQLNTLDRPGTETWVKVPARDDIEKIAEFFSEAGISVDVIESNSAITPLVNSDEMFVHIKETLSRRPCTAEDIAKMTGYHINEVLKKLGVMMKEGIVKGKDGSRGFFYMIPRE